MALPWQGNGSTSFLPAESPFDLSDIENPDESPSSASAGLRAALSFYPAAPHSQHTSAAMHMPPRHVAAAPFNFGGRAPGVDLPVPAAAVPGSGSGCAPAPTTNPFAGSFAPPSAAAAASAADEHDDPVFTLGQLSVHSGGSTATLFSSLPNRSRSGSRGGSGGSSRRTSRTVAFSTSTPAAPSIHCSSTPSSPNPFDAPTPGSVPISMDELRSGSAVAHPAHGRSWRQVLPLLLVALLGAAAFLVGGGASLAELGSTALARMAAHRVGAPPPRPGSGLAQQLVSPGNSLSQGQASSAIGPTRAMLSKDGAGTTPDSAGQPFRFLVRVLSSGAEQHMELARLLDSLQGARYQLGVDAVDVEILVDYPANLTLPRAPSPLPPHATDAEIAAHARATELALRMPHDPTYLSLKYENELTQILARTFSWVHGQLRVHVVQPDEAPMQSGPLNALLRWEPATAAAGHGDEWALHLRDTNVVSPMYFQAIKRIIREHFGPESSASTAGGGKDATLNKPTARLHPDALIGALLEPPEFVLAAPSGERFDASQSPETLVRKSLPKEFSSNPASTSHPSSARPTLIYTQSLSTVGGGVGGLLLRGSRFAEFKRWLVEIDLVRPLRVAGTDRGALPPPLVYSRGNATRAAAIAAQQPGAWPDPCVPGSALNSWAGPDAATAARWATRGGRAGLERAHRMRMASHWLPLLLLQRFVYERGLYALSWLPPQTSRAGSSASSQALVSSSAYTIPHAHRRLSHNHADQGVQQAGVASDGHDDGHDPGLEMQLPLPPLKRTLVPIDSPLWGWPPAVADAVHSQDAQITTVVPLLFDLSFRAQPIRSTSAAPPEEPVPMLAACATVPPGAPKDPPSYTPSPSELAALQSSLEARRQAAETAAAERRAREAALLDPHGDSVLTPEEAEIDEELRAMELAAQGATGIGPGSEGTSSATPPTSSDSAELVRAAIRTAESHSVDLTLSAYESGVAGFVDGSSGFPLIRLGGGQRIADPSALWPNATEFEQARWDEYEADYQMALTRAAGSTATAQLASIRQRHEELRRGHVELMRTLREELAKKVLVDSLREQLLQIEEEEQERRDEKLAEEWRRKEKERSDADQTKNKAKGKNKDGKKTSGGDAATIPPPGPPLSAAASALLDESLQRKRTTGRGSIESAEEFRRLMDIIRERRRNKQHQPLFLG